LFLPKLKPHAFTVKSPRLRILALFVPAGLAGYFRAMSSPAEKLELPTGAATYSTSNLEDVFQAFKKYAVRILSPDEVAEQMPLYFAALNGTPRNDKRRCVVSGSPKLLEADWFRMLGIVPASGTMCQFDRNNCPGTKASHQPA
jgi:hypothetical protein